jgi:hypothetical protein
MAGRRYNAFISYSRSASASVAKSVQIGIERYAKPWNKVRAAYIFRDDSNMSANPGLWSAIRDGLEASEWFVLIASPEAARSEYVNREVSWWLANREASTLLLVRSSGEIAWDEGDHCFVAGGESAIPKVLAHAYAEEPRWVDLSWYTSEADRSDPRFESAVADLSSAIREIDRDELVSENIREAKRLRRLTRTGVATLTALLALSVAAGLMAFSQRVEATEQRDEALDLARIATSRQLAAESRIFTQTDMQTGVLAAVAAEIMNHDQQSVSALYEAATASPHLIAFRRAGSTVTATSGTPNGRAIVAGTATGDVLLWRDILSEAGPERIMTLQGSVTFVDLNVSEDGWRVVASAETTEKDPDYDLVTVVETDAATWHEGVVTTLPFRVDAVSPSGETLVGWKEWNPDAVLGSVGVVVHSSDGESQQFRTGRHMSALVVPDDNTVVTMDSYGNSALVDLATDEVKERDVPLGTHLYGMAFSSDGHYFTYNLGARNAAIWRMRGPRPKGVANANTAGAFPDDVALSRGGRRVATSTNGHIVVGESTLSPHRGTHVLTGAGRANPHTLHFLADDIIISASGDSVSIWDLSRGSRLAQSSRFRVPNQCNACGPPQIAVNEDGTWAAMLGSWDDVVIVNLETMRTRWLNGALRSLGWDYHSDSGATAVDWWCDNLVMYSAGAQQVAVLPGPQFSLPRRLENVDLGDLNTAEGEDALLVDVEGDDVFSYRNASFSPDFRVDRRGHLIAASGTMLSDLDLSTGELRQVTFPGGHLNNDGSVAVLLTQNLDGQGDMSRDATRIQLFDIASYGTIFDVEISGRLIAAHAPSRQEIYVWRAESGKTARLLRINTDDSTTVDLGPIEFPAAFNVAEGNGMASVSNGIVTVTGLRDNTSTAVTRVRQGVEVWTGLGLSGDGRWLVIANEESEDIVTIPATPEQWRDAACEVAGGGFTEVQWQQVEAPFTAIPQTCT